MGRDQTERNVSDSDTSNYQAIAPAVHVSDLLEDIEQLPAEHHLLSSGEFEVYCTTIDHIPSVMHEIGRMRESNFRQVGEGTGQSLDIDQFDKDYHHLFVWDREKHKLVGAYR
ncbi:putative hemolysin [Vibrio maritimus]|uniref:L-ornithine N(alpha)-acyltransferase n=1 Tax=Vibrio maritimus TaxID=990268 RepID=A0A090S4D6_9VIBR|nr:putative hemolysin [Vibrio maritimus]